MFCRALIFSDLAYFPPSSVDLQDQKIELVIIYKYRLYQISWWHCHELCQQISCFCSVLSLWIIETAKLANGEHVLVWHWWSRSSWQQCENYMCIICNVNINTTHHVGLLCIVFVCFHFVSVGQCKTYMWTAFLELLVCMRQVWFISLI